MEYISMEAIKARHQGHFFDQGAMRFFDSRLAEYGALLADGSVLFVTSERFDYKTPRRYTVRLQNPDGRMTTKTDPVLKFQQFDDSTSAWRALRKLAQKLEG